MTTRSGRTYKRVKERSIPSEEVGSTERGLTEMVKALLANQERREDGKK